MVGIYRFIKGSINFDNGIGYGLSRIDDRPFYFFKKQIVGCKRGLAGNSVEFPFFDFGMGLFGLFL